MERVQTAWIPSSPTGIFGHRGAAVEFFGETTTLPAGPAAPALAPGRPFSSLRCTSAPGVGTES